MLRSQNVNHLTIIEGNNLPEKVRKRSVYLEGGQPFYKDSTNNPITKVAPFNGRVDPSKIFQNNKESNSVLYNSLRPIITLRKIVGILPISNNGQMFQVTPQLFLYSIGIFLLVIGYIAYISWGKIDKVASAEGRFEEAVIDYLFSIYLVPIVINIICWYEAKKQARVLTKLVAFEKIYSKVTKKKFVSFLGHKPMIVTVALPILAITTMVITHVTMVQFKQFKPLQIIPYCYINMVTYLLGGSWYMYCDLIGKTATTVANDFQLALKNIGPSSRVAEYRSLWLMLTKITKDIGNAFGYAMVFLCLYLFLIITLTIYGLLSQIQEGLGLKDIGLAITAFFAGAMLFFVSDEAHYASNTVRAHFQKKLLLVELTWMSEDAQQEVSMFLRATEMNPTDISLVGFFVVNRNLFKSLIATMVTYLVVLLQFQISIPEENNDSPGPLTNTTQI